MSGTRLLALVPTPSTDPGAPVTTLVAAPTFDLEAVLASIDRMSSQRPVAAQIVSAAGSEDTSAAQLSRILAADLPLASRVLKLSNSAFYGMRGRVPSLQFAVTVVGFATVRTMATVALTDLDDESALPEGFWDVSTCLALAASTLAPRFGYRAPDALCLGLLTQLGAALLHSSDTDGYAQLWAEEPAPLARRAAEVRRYGISAPRLTAVALEQWGFPPAMVQPLIAVDDLGNPDGALLRAALEVATRISAPDRTPVPVGVLTGGRLREDDVVPLLDQVRTEAAELRRTLFEE